MSYEAAVKPSPETPTATKPGAGAVGIVATSGESSRHALQSRALRGTFQVIPSAAVTELLAHAGFDFVVIDGEHSVFTIPQLENLVRAGESRGVAVLYRVTSMNDDISKALDTGVAGIVAPRLESAQDARQLVAATRFPPLGERGLGAGRAAMYGLEMAQLRQRANEEVLVIGMIETRAGLEALGEIIAVEGVDVIMVGPTDLASSLGIESGSAEHAAAVDHILGAALAAGKVAGTHCADAADASRRENQGARFLPIGIDSMFLFSAAVGAATVVAAGTTDSAGSAS